MDLYGSRYTATAANAAISKIKSENCKHEIPAKNNIAITNAPITSVDPRSGWDIIRIPKSANTTKGLTKPNEVLISLSLLTQ